MSGSRLLLRPAVVAALAVASISSLVLTQAPLGPGRTVDGEQVTAVASVARVELARRKGHVTGDGRTVYVANSTEFRPRRGTVAIPPRVRARAWAVVDLDTGRLLGKHRARTHLPQASTMKLLTALTATRTVSRTARHRVTRYEARQICSCAGLRPGWRYTRDTLLAGMLLPSGNDAAEAVAGSHPRGRHAFYRAMNRLADELGATDTVARNASGLTAPGSHSSARDLLLLLRAALRDTTVAGILALPSAEVASVSGRDRHTVWRGTDYVNSYPSSLGKSGWTTPAQNTLTVATEIGGHRIGVASLGAPSGHSTSGARALTEWAAENFAGLRAVGRLPRS
jgi:D-alanyl-D-alanine carboxypeptidase (penicillin-binding protein 5/6)